MNARGKAFIAAFDEHAASGYDCSPAGVPIIFGDPWAVRIEQLKDRVIFTTKKTTSCEPCGWRKRPSEAPIGVAVHARLLHRTIRRESARGRDQSVHLRSRGVRR